MAKKVQAYIKLQVAAGKANPSPPVGPALGQHGVNIMEFCKSFNARTQNMEAMMIPVVITVYSDRSFTFITKTPPTPILLKKAAGLSLAKKPGSGSKTPPAAKLLLQAAGVAKGSGEPHKTKVAKVSMAQVREIAQTKMEDLNANDIDQAAKIIAGTARSMGITVE